MPFPIYYDLQPVRLESLKIKRELSHLEKEQEYLNIFSPAETPMAGQANTRLSCPKIRLAIPAKLDDLESRDMSQYGINAVSKLLSDSPEEPLPAQYLLSRPRRNVRSVYARTRVITVTKTVKIPVLADENLIRASSRLTDTPNTVKTLRKKKLLPFSIEVLLKPVRKSKKAAKRISNAKKTDILTAGFRLVDTPFEEIMATASYEELMKVRARYLKSRLSSLQRNEIHMKMSDRQLFLAACERFNLIP